MEKMVARYEELSANATLNSLASALFTFGNTSHAPITSSRKRGYIPVNGPATEEGTSQSHKECGC